MWKAFVWLLILIPFVSSAQKADSSRISRDTVKMKDVVVSTKVAVKISGDTISYNVDSLTKNPNATAEDALKKIPGVEITPEGKIMVNGKEMTKIFINGKIYTSEDIRTLTQNLPAQIIEKMQLADWYDEDAQFTGIKKGSTEKMLNLKIKKNYEQGIYGQAIAGAGTKNTYQAGTFTNYMSHNTRITAIAKMNNTGMSDVGITSSGNADNTKTSNPSATGITRRRLADITFSNDAGGKLKLNGSYNAWYNGNTQTQSSLRNTYLPGDSSLIQQQQRNVSNNSLNHRLSIRSDWAIDSMQSLQSDAGFSYRKNDAVTNSNDGTYYNNTDNLSFTRKSDISSAGEGYGLNLNNNYRRKFYKPKRTLTANASIRYNKDNNTGDNYNTNQYYYPADTNKNDFVSGEDKIAVNARGSVSYNEPITKYATMTLSYSYTYNKNENDRNVSTILNGYRYTDSTQSRLNNNYSNEHGISLSYYYNKDDKFRFSLQMDAQPFSRGISLSGFNNNYNLKQNGVNYSPGLYTRYDFSKTSNISLHYNVALRVPELSQLQVIPDYRDSLNIYLGNPGLMGEKRHNVYLYIMLADKKAKSSFSININANLVQDKVVNDITITASKRVSKPVNANGYYSTGISMNYNSKLNKYISYSLAASGNQSSNITITNGVQQLIPNTTWGLAARISFNNIDWYEGDITYNIRNNRLTTISGITNDLQTHTVAATGTFILPLQFRIIYFINYIHNEGLTASYNPDFMLFNGTIEKSFNKPKGVTLRAQGFDVFNNYPNVQRTFGDNYYEDRQANRLGRFFIFSLVYKFTYFPYKDKE